MYLITGATVQLNLPIFGGLCLSNYAGQRLTFVYYFFKLWRA